MARHWKTYPYQLAVTANDFHIPFHDEKVLLLFKLFLRRERPDWLILNGDFQDFWEISRYDITPRTGNEFEQEIEIGKRVLRSFRRSVPRARITWIERQNFYKRPGKWCRQCEFLPVCLGDEKAVQQTLVKIV